MESDPEPEKCYQGLSIEGAGEGEFIHFCRSDVLSHFHGSEETRSKSRTK